MSQPIISAIFPDHHSAEKAIDDLRRAGVSDDAIAVVGRHGEEDADGQVRDRPDNKGSGALKGLGVGAGVGALFGLGALVIPGVGPFIAAGSLIEGLGVVGSAAASGAIVGGTAGGIAGALMHYGVSEAEAHDYERRIREGGIWVAVNTRRTEVSRDLLARLLHDRGGESVHTSHSAALA